MVTARITSEVCQVECQRGLRDYYVCATSLVGCAGRTNDRDWMSRSASVGAVSTKDFSVRAANDSDIDQCARLRANVDSGDVELWHERFASDLHNPTRRFLVADIGGTVVGYGHTVRHE